MEGSVRDRLLWALLAESGMRLGEALVSQHRDWHTGLGDMPFVEAVPREDHPHGLRVKNGGYGGPGDHGESPDGPTAG